MNIRIQNAGTGIKRWKKLALAAARLTLAAAVALTIFGQADMAAEAAETAPIFLEAGRVFPAVGETKKVLVEYTDSAGGFANLGVICSDPAVAAVSLEDAGNGRAWLQVQGLNFGLASVAVYQISDPTVAAYIAVYSGFAENGDMYAAATQDGVMAVYDDCVISWQTTLNGKNGAQLAVAEVELEQNSGIDCLVVTGDLVAKDSELGGMSTFYANFYDAGGGLIRRQAVFTAEPTTYSRITLKWYLPKGCAQVVLE